MDGKECFTISGIIPLSLTSLLAHNVFVRKIRHGQEIRHGHRVCASRGNKRDETFASSSALLYSFFFTTSSAIFQNCC